MPRKGPVKKREILPDPLYKSLLVSRFINKVMRDGKKSLASKIVYKAFEIVKERTKKDPLEVFEQALRNCSPVVEVRPRRLGGAVYQVPVEVPADRKITLGMRWLIMFARNKKGQPMWVKLAEEIINAYNNTGDAVKKRDDTHKMAEANRAFAHLARIR